MSADKPRLWGSARLPLPYLALLVLFGSIPLAMLLGTLPSSSSTRLLFLERFLADGEHAVQQPLVGAESQRNGSAPRRQRCAVFNGVNFHLDVTAGLAWAFQEAGCDTNVYMHPSALGLQEIMKGWLRGELLPRERMEADQPQYDVLVLATFPEGPTYQDRQNRLLLSRPPHQRILLGVHNPGWLLDNAGQVAPPLLLAQALPHAGSGGGRPQAPPPVQLLSLAPIGSAYTRSLLRSWLADMQRWVPELGHVQPRLEVPWIAPLVPWVPSDAAARDSSNSSSNSSSSNGSGTSASGGDSGDGTGSSSSGGESGSRHREEEAEDQGEYAGKLQHLCIQGTIHPKRRDYQAAFAAAAHPAVLAQLEQRKERLLLVGTRKQRPPVPAPLQPFVKTLSSLSYSDYYDTLSRCRAILTAFRSDQYLINKTSSTLAAALQVGTPLVTEDRVLAAYEYVPRAAAFFYAPPNGAAQPDAAELAAAEGRRQSQWMRQQAAAREQFLQRKAGARRRLEEQEDSGKDQRQGEDEEGGLAGSTGEEAQQQQSAAPTGAGRPPPGSYAAALLHAFDDAAARAAHTAAWRAKRAVMRRNAEVARQVMREAAALAAAARGAPH